MMRARTRAATILISLPSTRFPPLRDLPHVRAISTLKLLSFVRVLRARTHILLHFRCACLPFLEDSIFIRHLFVPILGAGSTLL